MGVGPESEPPQPDRNKINSVYAALFIIVITANLSLLSITERLAKLKARALINFLVFMIIKIKSNDNIVIMQNFKT